MIEESVNQTFVLPEIWDKVPSEIWTKIIKLIHFPHKPKQTAEKRLVCQAWKSAIDSDFYFDFWLKDTQTSVPFSSISHVRVNRCTVETLVNSKEYVQSLRFQCFKELHLSGKIARENFVALANQMPEKLIISNEALMELNRLGAFQQDLEFRKELKSLCITSPKFEQIFQLDFPKLKELVIIMSESKSEITNHQTNLLEATNALFSFLESNAAITNLKLRLDTACFDKQWDLDKLSAFKLDRQFESLELSTDFRHLFSWKETVKNQRNLNEIKIYSPDSCLDRPEISTEEKIDMFESIMGTLRFNRNTLTTINLTSFEIGRRLNMKMFKHMENLKNLTTSNFSVCVPFRPKLLNLCELPISLKSLSLGYATCLASDLLQMSERLENLKNVQFGLRAKLDNLGYVDSTKLSQQILDNLINHVQRNRPNFKVSFILFGARIQIIREF